jgi:hypothetical protein
LKGRLFANATLKRPRPPYSGPLGFLKATLSIPVWQLEILHRI